MCPNILFKTIHMKEMGLVSLPVLSTLSALTPSSKNLLQMGGPIQFQAQHEVRNTYEYDLQWQTIYFFVKGT